MYRDIHILTVGTYTYTTDQRFQTAYHRQTNEWTMQIKWAQKRDAGMYGWYPPSVILALLRIHLSIKTHFFSLTLISECQISTIPIKSFSVRLNVVGMYFKIH